MNIFPKLKHLENWANVWTQEDLGPVVDELEKLNPFADDQSVVDRVDAVFADPEKTVADAVRMLATIRAGLDKPAEKAAPPTSKPTESVVGAKWFQDFVADHPDNARPLKALAGQIDKLLVGPLAQHRDAVHSRLQTVVESGDEDAVLATFKRFHDDLEKAAGPARPTPRPTPAGQTLTARPGAPVPAKEGVLGTLTKKVGPLPVWAFGGILIVLLVVASLLLWPRGPEIPPVEEMPFGLVTPLPEAALATQPAEPTIEPTPVPTPDVRTKYEVWKAQASDSAVGQMGYAGPDSAYPEVAPPLTPGILYDVIKYPQNDSWFIVLPQVGGQPAFYPREALEELKGDPQTGQPQILPMESIDQLYQGLRTKEVAGRQTSPIVILLVGVLGLLAIPLMLVEAVGRDELGDAIHTLLVITVKVLVAAVLPTLAYMTIAVGVLKIGAPNAVPIDPLVLQNLLDAYIIGVARWVSGALILWTIWVVISPIKSMVYDEEEDDYVPKWFPRFDLTPLANVFLMSGILSVIGILTVFAVAWGVRAGERVTNIQGVFSGFATNQTPALTSFAMFCLVTAIVLYSIENIRSGQFMATIGAVALSGVYFLIRYYAPTWHPVFPLVIAVVFTTGVFAVIYAISNTRRLVTALKWGDIMLAVVNIAALFMLSFGTV